MSTVEEEGEVYTDSPTSAPVSDMRLKIAMFEKPTKSQLTPQPSRQANAASPKPPAKLPEKKRDQDQAPTSVVLPPRNGKPPPEPGPHPPKNRSNEGPSPGSLRGVRQADRVQHPPQPKSHQSPTTPEILGPNDTLYPPHKAKKTRPTLPTRRPENMDLIRVDGKIYRRLPFVVPKESAPEKPPRPPVSTTEAEDKMAERKELYEDASSYRDTTSTEETQDVTFEDIYEEFGAFSETLRERQEEAAKCDDEELYDDINVTT